MTLSIKQSLNDQESARIYGLFIVEKKSFCLLPADWRYDPTRRVVVGFIRYLTFVNLPIKINSSKVNKDIS